MLNSRLNKCNNFVNGPYSTINLSYFYLKYSVLCFLRLFYLCLHNLLILPLLILIIGTYSYSHLAEHCNFALRHGKQDAPLSWVYIRLYHLYNIIRPTLFSVFEFPNFLTFQLHTVLLSLYAPTIPF